VQDKTVAILETRLGRQLGDLVVKHGGRPFFAPALAEIPDVDRAYIARLVGELESRPAQFAIFQTGVGTHALFKTTDELALTGRLLALLEKMTVVVRGPKPTGALRSRGVRIDISAADPFTTVQVLQALQSSPLAGARVIVQRYGGANLELDEALTARGAQVVEIPVYRWSLPADTRPLIDLLDALDRRQIDAVTVTNAAQVHNLFEVAQQLSRVDALRTALNSTLVASIGPVSTNALKKFGVGIGLEASPPKLGPLLSALNAALSR
jgi:uroporphyrinogen-III synthase